MITGNSFRNTFEPNVLGGERTILTKIYIDLNYVRDIDKNFSYEIGPSIFIANRILEISDIPFGLRTISFCDKLASSGLGINGFLMLNIPLLENEKLFFTSKIKFRYAHSIWFDKGLRNLDNYYQEFITAQVTAGVGYAF